MVRATLGWSLALDEVRHEEEDLGGTLVDWVVHYLEIVPNKYSIELALLVSPTFHPLFSLPLINTFGSKLLAGSSRLYTRVERSGV